MKIILTSFAVIAVFIITGCATSSQKPTSYKGAPKHEQPRLEVLPKANLYTVNKQLDASLQSKLNKKIDELFTKYHIAGISSTMLVPQKGFWEIQRGYVSKPDNIPVDKDTVFFWASVGKLITSTIVHQLILEGKLSFNDTLSKWYPDIQNADKITIEHLLTHTNGIYSFNADPNVHGSEKDFTSEELLEIAKSHENLFEPSEYWSYTNTGYLLLSFIIQKIEAKTLAHIVTDRISKPLNLKTLRVPRKNEPNLALAHDKDKVIEEDYSAILGAGAFVSSSKDMAVFLSALLTGKIIPIKNVHAMMKDLYPMFDNKGLYYGRGIMLYDFNKLNHTDNLWIGHSGGTENYKAILLYDVKTKIIMAISINENIPVKAVASSLMELVNEGLKNEIN